MSRATSSEKNTAAATVRPNCMKNCPVMPPMKLTGRKTAMIVAEQATTASPISSAASRAASKPLLPMRMWRTMFSISTMASSTSTPATSERARRLIWLSVKPFHCMKAKVGTADSGMARADIAVARMSRRKNLRDMRATAISALAIPLSAVPTFAFMQWKGFTLNQISLLALSLVAGVLVDDAIVEIENIVRHMRMGKSGFEAALDAADEIGLAVVACSATIIAVFLPVSFMGGITGQFFMQFGLTVAAAVFFSLLVARLITPVIAAYSLQSDSLKIHHDGPVMALYLRALRWCVQNRW